ncbi:hypothetical protein ACFWPX_30050 [Nocardia sp. NPDC058518]|uniref:hypothetical protein n=1 Tax=Nocardia sp. NPDC058518 TaxID=3346534 RepID=UPI0036654D2D
MNTSHTAELTTALSTIATRALIPTATDTDLLTETEARMIAAAFAVGPALRNYGRGIDVHSTKTLLEETRDRITEITEGRTSPVEPGTLAALAGLETRFRTRGPIDPVVELHQLYRTECNLLRARFGRADIVDTGRVMCLWAPQQRGREVLASNGDPGLADASTATADYWYVGIYTTADAIQKGEGKAADLAHAVDLAEISSAGSDYVAL